MCLCPSAIDMEAELTDLCDSASSVIEEPFRIEPSLPCPIRDEGVSSSHSC
jgi:hypothetical protein